MNNTFSLKRFVLLFKKHSLEHLNTYLLSTAVLAGILFVMLGFFAWSDDGRLTIQDQTGLFMFCMVGGGGIFTSLIFADLGDKRKATGILTLPASHFEKYLVAWLYSFIIYQLIFVAVFYIADWIVISVSSPPVNNPNKLINIFDSNQANMDPGASAVFIIFAMAHGLTFWGSVFFEKLHFIKSAGLFFVYLAAIEIINNPLLHLMTGKNYISGAAFGALYFTEDKHNWSIDLPDSANNTLYSFIYDNHNYILDKRFLQVKGKRNITDEF